MRYVMMTFVGTDHAEAWERATPDERQAEVDRTVAWFREHGAGGHIVGGEELADPSQARTLRRRGVTDGPFIETKELLGGFIVLEAPDEAAALRIAGGWPGLDWDGDAVEVRPVGDSQAAVTGG
jgi:hypothetical protein